MMARAGSLPVFVLLAASAGAGLGAQSARAEDACLGAPNGPAPAGSHWYYRTDQATQHKCWYVRPRDQTAQTSPAQEKPVTAAPAQERPAAATAPAAAPPNAAADRSPWPDPAPSADASATAWPNPPSRPSANAPATVWPDPPPLQSSTGNSGTSQVPLKSADTVTQDTTGSTPAAPSTTSTGGSPSSGHTAVNSAGNSADKAGSPQSETSIGLILTGLIVLLMAGLIVRRMVIKAFAHRRLRQAVRQEPIFIESATLKRPMPTLLAYSPSLVPDNAETEQRIDEVEETLRKLAQRLRRRRFSFRGVWARSS